MKDRERGLQALRFFYNNSSSKAEYNNITFEDFIAHIDKTSKSFISGLGLGINFNLDDKTFDMDDVKDSMITLSSELDGKVPVKLQQFKTVLIDQASKMDFDFWSKVSEDTINDLLVGAEYVGKNVITASKSILSLSKHAKWVLLGGGVIAMMYYGNIFKKVLKK